VNNIALNGGRVASGVKVMSEHYVVAYNGQLAEGKTLEAAKQGVAQLFKVDVARIEHLFNGKWASIKQGVDEATAKKYQGALAKIGALCKVVTEAEFAELKAATATAEVDRVSSPATTSVAAAAPVNRPQQSRAAPASAADGGLVRSVVREAPAGMGALEGISVAANWDHLEEHDAIPPPQVDLSGVALAEAGSTLVAHQEVPALEVDTSELSLDALGVDMASHEEVAALTVDTSGMTLDEPGVIIVEPKQVKPLEVDTSKISLE
jgi:hypothetical protein